MIRDLFNIILRFIFLVLLQVLILNQVVLHGLITPYIYPLFILLLPLRTPKWLLLFLGLAMGVTIDTFSNTGGIHAFATVFLAFIRPFIIKMLTPPDDYESDDKPTIKSLGFSWFLLYTVSGILLHHAVFFIILILNFAHPEFLILKIVLSSIVSIGIILLLQLLFYPKKIGKS